MSEGRTITTVMDLNPPSENCRNSLRNFTSETAVYSAASVLSDNTWAVLSSPSATANAADNVIAVFSATESVLSSS